MSVLSINAKCCIPNTSTAYKDDMDYKAKNEWKKTLVALLGSMLAAAVAA